MVLTSCWAISAEWPVTKGGNAMQYVVGAWRLLRRREEAGAKERRKRALEAEEGAFGGD